MSSKYENLKKNNNNNLAYKNVLNYGIKNNGNTDITTNLQKLLDIAKTENGVNLLFPEGEYVIDGTLDVYSNTNIKFVKGAKIIRRGGSSRFFNIGAKSTKTGYGSGAKNINIDGGEFIGNITREKGIAFSMHHASNCIFKNMKFINANYTGHVFDLSGSNNILIDGCEFYGFTPIQGREFTEAIQIDFSYQGTFEGIDGGYDLLPTKDVTVQNCVFKPIYNEDGSIERFAPNPIGSHSYGTEYYKNIKFINNIVENCAPISTELSTTGTWLRFYAIDGIYIENNTFINTKQISQTVLSLQTKTTGYDSNGEVITSVLPPKNIHIKNNIFDGFNIEDANKKNSIILCYGRSFNNENYYINDLNIYNNNFINCTPDGSIEGDELGAVPIYIYLIDGVNIYNNQFNKVRRMLYVKEFVKNLNIYNNSLYTSLINFITVYNSEFITIRDNIFNNYTGSIFLNKSSNLIVKNNVFNNGNLKNIESIDKRVIRNVECVNTVIEGNSFIKGEGNTTCGISITTNSKNVLIRNNVIDDKIETPVEVTSTCTGVYEIENITSRYTYTSITKANKYQRRIMIKNGLDSLTNLGYSRYTATLKKENDDTSLVPIVKEALPSDIFTIFLGTNDYSNHCNIGTIDDELNMVNSFYSAMKTIINDIYSKNVNAKIFLITPLKRSDKSETNNSGFKLEDYVNAIIDISKLYSIPYIDLFNNSGINSLTFNTYLADGLHPNDIGYIKIGDIIAKTISTYL